MKYIGKKILILSMCFFSLAFASEVAVAVSRKATSGDVQAAEESVPLLIIAQGDHPSLPALIESIQTSLRVTGMVAVQVAWEPMPTLVADIKKKFSEGNSFVLYLTMHTDEACVHGRLYNALDAVMIEGKRWKKRDTLARWACHICHDVWRSIMGNDSSFLSSIAYIKRTEKRPGVVSSKICVVDWSGEHERAILTRPVSVLAPAWLHDSEKKGDYLLFSEFTPVNVRLMKTNCLGSVEIVFDGNGTTVGVGVLDVQHSIIYCRSGVLWRYSYDASMAQGTHEPIVSEPSAAACPVLLSNGDVLYCANGKIKMWHASDRSKSTVIGKGFSTSPAVHEKCDMLVYSSRVKGNLEIFLSDLTGNGQRQLTSGAGDKVDPTISPCGNFIAYTLVRGKYSVIAILTLSTGEVREVTEPTGHASCPSWSR